MESNSFISVIIPTFNRESKILRAVDSVIKQKGCISFDLWIVDDGSTDKTKEVLADYIKDNFLENKIHYLYQENQGVSSARNLGIEKSKGEWIAFLDSDDEWLEDKLLNQVTFMRDHREFDLIHGEEIWIRNGVRVNQMKKHRKEGGDIFIRSLELCLISPSAVMMKRSLLNKYNNFSTKMIVCEDYDLWLKITSENLIGFIKDPLIKKYGGHEDQLSSKFFAMDFWRVNSIYTLLESGRLTIEKKDAALRILLRKSEILIKGYLKHENLENIEIVEKIRDYAKSQN